MSAPLSKSQMIEALGNAAYGEFWSQVAAARLYRAYHAALHAAVEGRQRTKSAGWDQTVARVQRRVLSALRRAR